MQVERTSNLRALKGKTPYKRLPVDMRATAREGRADPDEVSVWVLVEEAPGVRRLCSGWVPWRQQATLS